MTSSINVTPMIDILLVLLIIFMVIVPALPRGERALSPRPSAAARPDPSTVVLEVLKGAGTQPTYRLNQQDVAWSELPARLTAIYANRAERVLFLKGDDSLSFTQVAQVIDIGHAAGIDHIGLMTPGTQSAQ